MQEELIQKFRDGNRKAGDDYYTANIKLVYYAAKLYRPMSVDEDETLALVNQAFAYSLRKYDPMKGTFATFFMISARSHIGNHCRDLAYMIRTKRRDFKETKKLVYCDSLDEVIIRSDLEDIALIDMLGTEDDQSRVVVDEMLKGISGIDRKIFTLYYLKGYVQLEIAKIIGTSAPSISRSLTRSRAALKISLKEVC